MKLFAALLLALPFADAESCGIVGNPIANRAYYSKKDARLATQKNCAARCKRDTKCKGYGVGKETYRNVKKNNKAAWKFYDRTCKLAITTSATIARPTTYKSTTSATPKTTASTTKSMTKSTTPVSTTKSTTTKDAGTTSSGSATTSSGSATTTSKSTTASVTTSGSSSATTTSISTTESTITSSYTTPSSTTASSTTESVSTTSSSATTTTTTSSAGPKIVDTPPETDSPPLTNTDPVVFPTDDPEFEDSYTYADDPLPTVTEMGSPPVTDLVAEPTDQPDLPCVLNPADPNAQFELFSSDFIAQVPNKASNSLGSIPTPTSQAEADALGPVDDYALPAFSFQQAEGAPANVYDMVMTGSTPRFVARAANGDVVLTDSSTGADGKLVDGQMLYTTIFGLNCRGRIAVTQGGQSFVFAVADKKTTIVAGSDGGNGMVTVPVVALPFARFRKRNQWNSGSAPRCPNPPSDLMAFVRPDARGLNPNGCGPANGIDFVPDLSFTSCCNAHDNCFDNCEGGTFESCNSDFHSCMRGAGCSRYDHWYSWPLYLGCKKAADFYAWAVSTNTGRNAFYASNTERCACRCTGGQSICNEGGNKQCRDIYSNDNNNCGGCGRTCPAKSRCSNGNCVCPQDQCGNRCLSLLTSPSNCGSCGNVCSTGYCYQGQCYSPPPGGCAATNGFKNGDFVKRDEGWTYSTIAGDPGFVGSVFDGGATDSLGLLVDFRRGTYGKSAFETEVRMCPGQEYDLTFLLRRPYGNGNCQMNIIFGGNSVYYAGLPGASRGQWNNIGPISTGAFYRGQPFVRTTGLTSKNLYVRFRGEIECRGDGSEADTVRMDTFVMSAI